MQLKIVSEFCNLHQIKVADKRSIKSHLRAINEYLEKNLFNCPVDDRDSYSVRYRAWGNDWYWAGTNECGQISVNDSEYLLYSASYPIMCVIHRLIDEAKESKIEKIWLEKEIDVENN